MNEEKMILSAILAGIIILVVFCIEVLYVKQKEYRNKIDLLKKSKPLKQYLDSLIYFKGESVSLNDVRESEVKRVLRDIQEQEAGLKVEIKHIKIALNQMILDRKNVQATQKPHSVKESISLNQIDQMSGIDFERFLKRFFEKRGYRVTITPASGDQGVDLILFRDNRKIAIQAKRYNQTNRVGNKAVQEVYAGKPYYDCDEACVITTSYFTSQAISLASKAGVKLIDRKRLQLLLKDQIKL